MIILNNVGSPVIGIVVAPITQLNISVLSRAPQLNAASLALAGLRR